MATVRFIDARIYVGGYDLSGDHNAIGITAGAGVPDGVRPITVRKGALKVVIIACPGPER